MALAQDKVDSCSVESWQKGHIVGAMAEEGVYLDIEFLYTTYTNLIVHGTSCDLEKCTKYYDNIGILKGKS